MRVQYRWGLLCGVVAGVLVSLLFVALMKHKKVIDCHFDERQELARGQAFKYAFFTLAALLLTYGTVDTIFDLPVDTLAGVFLCFCLSMAVFAVICIRKEAYLSLYEKPGKVMALFGFLAALNIGVGAVYCLQGDMVRQGILTFRVVHPMMGVLLLVIMAVYALHLTGRGEEEAE